MIGMGRDPRIHYFGAVYHAMARGVDGREIFGDDLDRTSFLEGLSRIRRETSAEVLAYCLMGNHFHLAIKVGPVALASIMQRILTSHSLIFNRRHDRTGHLFQARYKAILCRNDAYLAILIRYIHMNPVRAKLVLRPQDWRWSSFSGRQEENGCEADLMDFDPWSKEAVENADLHAVAEKREIADIGLTISVRTGVELDELRSDNRRRPVVVAKRLFAQEAIRNGHSLMAVALWLNMTPSSASRYVRANTAIRQA